MIAQHTKGLARGWLLLAGALALAGCSKAKAEDLIAEAATFAERSSVGTLHWNIGSDGEAALVMEDPGGAIQRSSVTGQLTFVREDGKGFVATHAGATAFFSWPEFGEMLGGRFDEHPWGISEATVIVEDRTSPISRHLPATFAVTDEHYQLKDFSRKNVHVLARLDPEKLDLKAPLVHRTDRDFVAAYTKEYGKGRVFYSSLGHPRELWDQPWMQQMYFEALKWAMGLP